MAKKKAFVLRIDESMLRMVERWAADEFRSVNGQLEWMVHQSLKNAGRMKKDSSPPASDTEETSTN